MTKNKQGFERFEQESEDKETDALADLQEKLQCIQDKRDEERFIFITIIILLLDVVFFTVMPTFTGPLALVGIELLVLIPVAKRMGMEEIAELLDRVINTMAGKSNSKKENKD